MALKDKYSELITAARATRVLNLQVKEHNGLLHIEGIAPSEEVKRKLWHLYGRIDQDGSNDVIFNITTTQSDGERNGETNGESHFN